MPINCSIIALLQNCGFTLGEVIHTMWITLGVHREGLGRLKGGTSEILGF